MITINNTSTAQLHFNKFNISLLEESADLYISVFSLPPWNDIYESRDEVVKFLRSFTKMSTFKGYQLMKDGKVIGLSVGFIKPWLSNGTMKPEYFIDQYCIDYKYQRQGLGRTFMKMIEEDLIKSNIHAIILNTEVHSPAFDFYKKTGFNALEDYSLLALEF